MSNSSSETPTKMTLEECVRAFLGLALVNPEKLPKQQYRQRENQATIIGYNRAQEDLRKILETHGRDKRVKAVAEVRNEKQQRPMVIGRGTHVWVMP